MTVRARMVLVLALCTVALTGWSFPSCSWGGGGGGGAGTGDPPAADSGSGCPNPYSPPHRGAPKAIVGGSTRMVHVHPDHWEAGFDAESVLPGVLFCMTCGCPCFDTDVPPDDKRHQLAPFPHAGQDQGNPTYGVDCGCRPYLHSTRYDSEGRLAPWYAFGRKLPALDNESRFWLVVLIICVGGWVVLSHGGRVPPPRPRLRWHGWWRRR